MMNISGFQSVCKQPVSVFFFFGGGFTLKALHGLSRTVVLFPESKKAVGWRRALSKHDYVPIVWGLDVVRWGGVSVPERITAILC